jgi:hypothetical protein
LCRFYGASGAEADLGTIVHNMISGGVQGPAAGGRLQHRRRPGCSEEIAYEVLDRAYDPDTTLSVGAKRFIDRHVTPGVKRPPAPSVRREPDQSVRKKA